MSNSKKIRFQLPVRHSYILTTLILFVLGVAIIVIGFFFDALSIWRVIFHAVGGAVVSLGLVEVLHEMSIARQVRGEFLVLADFIDKGIERICTSEEITLDTPDMLKSTKSLMVIGIGNSWLIKGANRDRLIEMIDNKHLVKILIPDPLSSEIRERYENDEPPTFEIGLEGLARRVLDWYNLKKEHPALMVRVFNRYPVVNISIYDKKIYVSPVLYKRRAKDSLTSVFRRPSVGAEIYEDHFSKVFEQGAKEITPEYLEQIRAVFRL